MTSSTSRFLPRLIGAAGAVLGGCSAATLATAGWSEPAAVGADAQPQLARFMRELVNVPFSFAMLEHDGAQRPMRFRGAAVVLREAARDLAHWQDPPIDSVEGREVFYAYAHYLERQVAQLERATWRHDTAETGDRLEDIRQTCNSCHRFFRPATAVSADVLYDRVRVSRGGLL